jgi:outer membrane protein assembly factor BamA
MARLAAVLALLASCGTAAAAEAPAPIDRAVTNTVAARATLPQPNAYSPSLSVAGDGDAFDPDSPAGEWVVAPIPIANPTLGAGLAVAAIYSFRPFPEDGAAKPSTFAVGGFYTDSDSRAFGAGLKGSYAADRWRLKLAGAVVDLNYNLYGNGGLASTRLKVHQSGSGGLVEVQRAVARELFVGLWLALGETKFVPRDGATPSPGIPVNEFDARVATIGLHLESDRRDSQYYPTHGHRAEYRYADQAEALGSDFKYRKQTAAYNSYDRLWGGVVASRIHLCQADGDVPFFDECLYGSAGDLRGYEVGRYHDEAMFAAQVEYRRVLSPRWGATAFVGTGQVMPDFGALGSNPALPAAGFGLRWTAAPANHINLRLDYANGANGDTFYIAIGEAF